MTYRALILRRLAASERSVEENERLIAAQRIHLAHAIQQGAMVTAHAARLRRLTESQSVHRAACDRLRAELRALDANPRGAPLGSVANSGDPASDRIVDDPGSGGGAHTRA